MQLCDNGAVGWLFFVEFPIDGTLVSFFFEVGCCWRRVRKQFRVTEPYSCDSFQRCSGRLRLSLSFIVSW